MDFTERFIPTPVGNTETKHQRTNILAVHPHACGEHSLGAGVQSSTIGSSPRLWGTLSISLNFFSKRRFIPTPVGNTRSIFLLFDRFSVHPHACGEHNIRLRTSLTMNGSSPRLWGTRMLRNSCQQALRFIPTPVGNTAFQPMWSNHSSVHPHACGEHLLTGPVKT